MNEATAPIIEIFSSLQGEGPYAGEQHLFVRFQGCSLSCQFCDTPASFIENPDCRVEIQPFSKKYERYPNPLSVTELNHIVARFTDTKTIAVTGGEPLESVDFIRAWLPTLEGRYRILLETAGIHYESLSPVRSHVDVISMDVKLPSVTGMRAYWSEHRKFLEGVGDTALYVKAVVSSETDETDLDAAIELVAAQSRDIPFILQPASPFAQFRAAPSAPQLNAWRERAAQQLSHVSVIPQLHKTLGIL
jgi:7-carboxy-7-deazaguanine synthase